MAYINQPPELRVLFSDLDQRLRKLELAQRFTAPNVNFNTNTPTNPRVGDIFYDTNTYLVKYWNGTAWVIFADNNLGTPVIPYTPLWLDTGLTYNAGTVTGRYMKIGKMITYSITVDCSGVTNFGTGVYSVTLPTGYIPAYNMVHMGGIVKSNTEWSLIGEITAGSDEIVLAHPAANATQDIFSYNKPTTLTTTSTWHISGSYFIA